MTTSTFHIGVAGSRGKSLVTALLTHVLQNAELPQAVQVHPITDAANAQAHPWDALVFLNFIPTKGRDANPEAELSTVLAGLENAKPETLKILCLDTPELKKLASKGGFTSVSVTSALASYTVDENGEFWRGDKLIGDVSVFEHLPGLHNWQNIACAYAVLKAFNQGKGLMTDSAFFTGVQTFPGLPHRLFLAADKNNIRFFNDSFAADATGAITALQSFADVFWICGGRPRPEGLQPLIEAGVLPRIRSAFTIGEAAKANAATLREHGVPAFDCTTLEKAVSDATTVAAQSGLPRPVVLLAPACPGFDQYRDDAQRGEAFTKLVKQL